MSDQVRVNGNLLARQSCTLKCNNEPFYGWSAIEWSEKRERAYGYGAGRHGGPLGMTPGKYEPGDLVITFFKHTAQAVEVKLAQEANDGTSVGNPSVVWQLTISEPDLATSIVVFEGCRLVERSNSAEDSAEAMQTKHTYKPLRIREDDLTLFDSSVAGA